MAGEDSGDRPSTQAVGHGRLLLYNGTDPDTVAKRRLRPAPEVAPPLAEKDLGVGSELEFFWKDEAWWEITVTGIRCDGAIRVSCCSGANEYKHLIERGDVARLLRRRTA